MSRLVALILATLSVGGCGRTGLLGGGEGAGGGDGGAGNFDGGLNVSDDGGSNVNRDGGSNGGTDGGVPTSPTDVCSIDTIPGGATSGTVKMPSYFVDLAALCNGWIAFADAQHDEIAFFNPLTGQSADGVPLRAAPGRLTLDRQQHLLYAALDPADGIARVDLMSGLVSYLDGADVTDVAVGNEGQVLGITPTYPQPGPAKLQVFDGAKSTLRATLDLTDTLGVESLLVYDRTHNFVITGGGRLFRYTLDPQTLALSLTQSILIADVAPFDLALSPDGRRLGLIVYEPQLQINDYATDDFTVINGHWNTTFTPAAGTFTDDQAYFIASDDTNLLVFDSTTYATIATVAPSVSWKCSNGAPPLSGGPRRVSASRGGRLAFLLDPSCPFEKTGGYVVYTTLP